MNYLRWRKICATALLAAGFGGVVSAADMPAKQPGRIVVIREAGKPDRHCVVLRSTVLPDGSTVHEVRNVQTGETFRVADPRTATTVTPKPPVHRLPTTAELAGANISSDHAIQPAGFFKKPKTPMPPAAPKQPPATAQPATTQPPASLQEQLANLREGIAPSQRELAAMALTLGESHKSPEVVAALMNACRTDPAPMVRATCIRCLFRLAPDAPQVIPIIEERKSDKNVEVQKLAALALEELHRQSAEKERR